MILSVDGRALERLGAADVGRLMDLCVRCTEFFELIGGEPATEATAQEILGPLAGKLAAGTKHVVVSQTGRLEGTVSILKASLSSFSL